MSLPKSEIIAGSQRHPRPSDEHYAYGTAGFRFLASRLDPVMYRVGLVAALRSKQLGGKIIGVMVTASHNPERDNGVKLVDPQGEMLEAAWETHATTVSNASTDEALIAALESIVKSCNIDLSQPSHIVLGYDTRPSGPALVASLKDGLDVMSVRVTDFGLCTTPQLHYYVVCSGPDAFGEPSQDGYNATLVDAYETLTTGRSLKPDAPPLTVDCANGIGAPALESLLAAMKAKLGTRSLPVTVVRDDVGTLGVLNKDCGADYVKVGQCAPKGLELRPGSRYCSLDGDADRIVFYYADETGKFKLLDGDKIATLAAAFIIELVKQAGLDLDVGVVQTAYANGSSTRYVESLGIPVTCTPTGVKYLHHAAEKFDIGVYFEANGHGTVVFSPSAREKIASSAEKSPAAAQLLAMTLLINRTVGDALSDMLLVEVILLLRGWSCKEWDEAYQDLPNRLMKVSVKDRTAFKVTDAERKLVEPNGVQAQIDELVSRCPQGRSFVRPSGTEDVVRVYAEAAKDADQLAKQVARLIFDSYGLGSLPAELA